MKRRERRLDRPAQVLRLGQLRRVDDGVARRIELRDEDVVPGEERFPDMSDPYDAGFRRIAEEVARELRIPLVQGVYAAVLGPSYETPAEIRMLRTLGKGVPICVTVTHLDGLVLARSAFHHSMNYRSAVVFGTAREVTDRAEKLIALDALVEHVLRGRSSETRPANEKELKQTMVLALPIDEASAKVRTGPPLDDEEDYALPVWAGVVPLKLEAGEPVPDPRLSAEISVPEYARHYRRS